MRGRSTRTSIEEVVEALLKEAIFNNLVDVKVFPDSRSKTNKDPCDGFFDLFPELRPHQEF